jgi:hypothetical protein
MRSVLLRHYPELAVPLEGVRNPFAPWAQVADRRASGNGAVRSTTRV